MPSLAMSAHNYSFMISWAMIALIIASGFVVLVTVSESLYSMYRFRQFPLSSSTNWRPWQWYRNTIATIFNCCEIVTTGYKEVVTVLHTTNMTKVANESSSLRKTKSSFSHLCYSNQN